MRKMVRETRMDKSSLIYPMFVTEGTNIKQEIPTMPGQYRYSVDRLPEALEEVADAGVPSVMLFGIPDHKDACGSGAWAEDGIVQKAFRKAKETVPELYMIGDVCMCEYTSHGHCGILDGDYVDNDKTLDYLAKIALSQVQAGADMVAPSDMMDGRVAAIRRKLDENGYCTVPIMSYAAKYASAFYGPFRDAADSAPAFGDPKDLPDGLSQPEGGHEGGFLRPGRGGGHYYDQARSFLSGYYPGDGGRGGRAGGGLQRQRGVRPDQGRRKAGLCGGGKTDL